jgi:hypothetical protein
MTREMRLANPLWGAPRIHGELPKLGIEIGQTSVAKCVARMRKPHCKGGGHSSAITPRPNAITTRYLYRLAAAATRSSRSHVPHGYHLSPHRDEIELMVDNLLRGNTDHKSLRGIPASGRSMPSRLSPRLAMYDASAIT